MICRVLLVLEKREGERRGFVKIGDGMSSWRRG